jgi:hypothetical protein
MVRSLVFLLRPKSILDSDVDDLIFQSREGGFRGSGVPGADASTPQRRSFPWTSPQRPRGNINTLSCFPSHLILSRSFKGSKHHPFSIFICLSNRATMFFPGAGQISRLLALLPGHGPQKPFSGETLPALTNTVIPGGTPLRLCPESRDTDLFQVSFATIGRQPVYMSVLLLFFPFVLISPTLDAEPSTQ